MAAKIELTGKRYGHLLVTSFFGKERNVSGISVRKWECLCDCGNISIVPTGALQSGNTITCGCKLSSKATKHGLWEARIYKIWADMKVRCKNPQHKSYPNYGGRGINYDPAWEDFEAFYEDMQEGYDDTLTLERNDTNLGYNKGNCSWALKLFQSRNRRMIRRNTSGVTGVRWTTDKSGTLYAAGSAMVDGKAREKHFSTNKYGLLPAFKLAWLYRKNTIDELNAKGYGYSEGHGAPRKD